MLFFIQSKELGIYLPFITDKDHLLNLKMENEMSICFVILNNTIRRDNEKKKINRVVYSDDDDFEQVNNASSNANLINKD